MHAVALAQQGVTAVMDYLLRGQSKPLSTLCKPYGHKGGKKKTKPMHHPLPKCPSLVLLKEDIP